MAEIKLAPFIFFLYGTVLQILWQKIGALSTHRWTSIAKSQGESSRKVYQFISQLLQSIVIYFWTCSLQTFELYFIITSTFYHLKYKEWAKTIFSWYMPTLFSTFSVVLADFLAWTSLCPISRFLFFACSLSLPWERSKLNSYNFK